MRCRWSFNIHSAVSLVNHSGFTGNRCSHIRPHPDPLPSDGRGYMRHAVFAGKARAVSRHTLERRVSASSLSRLMGESALLSVSWILRTRLVRRVRRAQARYGTVKGLLGHLPRQHVGYDLLILQASLQKE